MEGVNVYVRVWYILMRMMCKCMCMCMYGGMGAWAWGHGTWNMEQGHGTWNMDMDMESAYQQLSTDYLPPTACD